MEKMKGENNLLWCMWAVGGNQRLLDDVDAYGIFILYMWQEKQANGPDGSRKLCKNNNKTYR